MNLKRRIEVATREVGTSPRNVNTKRVDGRSQASAVKNAVTSPKSTGVTGVRNAVNSPKP